MRIVVRSLAVAAIMALSACSPRTVDPSTIVFGPAPLDDMKQHAASFKQLPKEQLQLVVAYLGANELSKIKNGPYSQIQGKGVPQVYQEAQQWYAAVQKTLESGRVISAQINQAVTVSAKDKQLSQQQVDGKNVDVMTVTYQILNRSQRNIAGLQGRAVFLGPDGKPAAIFNVSFSEKLTPGQYTFSTGGGAFRIGSDAGDPIKHIASSPLANVRMVFEPLLLVFDNGERLQMPSM